ncbi:cytochrome P450 [Paraglaciecola aquimarina]|uniref:Cytochrome P450 n=1 Tax=Paraglaciecola aquimarina TaxID=1235557 RepID=A0ABU3SZP3_9ALTE|nr:cytochrome P450 [Paraglaciecola aquimarina]MDU0355392.1 cytochrome P450 [Paraglaciecola aquimarina]
MKQSDIKDPFVQARQQKGYAQVSDQDDPVTMMLRLKDVRKCAHNAKTFSSEDIPGRIVVPSEVNIRTTRQIPFEVDPPKHKGFRSLLDPWFKRPLEAEYKQKLHAIVDDLLSANLAGKPVEIIKNFSLILQSRALTLLLNTPFTDAELWISWGTHVFRSEGEALDGNKAQVLYDYLDKKLDQALANPTDDLFSVLLNAEVDGKKMSKEEAKGVLILTFAGGRDTVINAVSNTIAYLADHPESLQRLREEPDIRGRAIEEFIRYFSPLTHMGRVVKEDTQVCEHAAKADTRISLCWASANRDETVFENPNEIVLDRKLNPHVGFGFSHHNCLGATHARQILSILIDVLCEKVSTIDLLDAEDNIEHWDDFDRKVGYESLTVKFNKA